jgi:hypothetical protein
MGLFAEHLLVALESVPAPTLIYDEERGLNLDAQGRVFVEQPHVSGTETVTEVDGEHQDRDPDGALALGTETVTKVRGERDDISSDEHYAEQARTLLETETAIGGEQRDHADWCGWNARPPFGRGEAKALARSPAQPWKAGAQIPGF